MLKLTMIDVRPGHLIKVISGDYVGYYGIIQKCTPLVILLSNGLQIEVQVEEIEALPLHDGSNVPASFPELIRDDRLDWSKWHDLREKKYLTEQESEELQALSCQARTMDTVAARHQQNCIEAIMTTSQDEMIKKILDMPSAKRGELPELDPSIKLDIQQIDPYEYVNQKYPQIKIVKE